MKTPLLRHASLEKGAYRLEVILGPPTGSCDGCEQLTEIYTDYYFSYGHISASDSAQVDSITSILRSFPEVKQIAHHLPNHEKIKGKLAIWVDHYPSPGKNYYVFGAGVCTDSALNPYFYFHVWSDPFVIKYFDPVFQREMPLEEWHKNRERLN
jgi:hypothetical protein